MKFCIGCGAELKDEDTDLCDVCKVTRFWTGWTTVEV